MAERVPETLHEKSSPKAPALVKDHHPAESQTAETPVNLGGVLDQTGPENIDPQAVLHIQRMAGNRAVSRLIMRRLTVGAAHDPLEQEADQTAAQVMHMQVPSQDSRVDRAAEEEEEVQTQRVQRQEDEEEIQTRRIQRQEDEDEIQTKALVQRQEDEDEIQTKPLVQRQEDEDEIQTRRIQRQEDEEEIQIKPLIQRQEDEDEIQTKPLINGRKTKMRSKPGGSSARKTKTRSKPGGSNARKMKRISNSSP